MLPKFNVNRLAALLDPQLDSDERQAEILVDAAGIYSSKEVILYLTKNPPSPRVIYALMCKAQERLILDKAASGGNAKAAKLKKPKEEICKVWASGNFANRDICAEQEYSSLGFDSFKTARNALKGTPDPDPWPAKVKKKK